MYVKGLEQKHTKLVTSSCGETKINKKNSSVTFLKL